MVGCGDNEEGEGSGANECLQVVECGANKWEKMVLMKGGGDDAN